jgi:hypothetical protein
MRPIALVKCRKGRICSGAHGPRLRRAKLGPATRARLPCLG